MLRGQPTHGCMDVSRRAFFVTVLGLVTPRPAAATGFHVQGVLSTTDESDVFMLGHQFGLLAAPHTEPHRLLLTMLNAEVRVHVEPE